MKIRRVEPTDAFEITSIYNYYILNTIITFEEEMINVAEMEKRIRSISSDYPFLVAADEDSIIGYAYATAWKTRSAYRYSAEVTIYLKHDKVGVGIGFKLYSALIDELKRTKLHVLVGGIALPNHASIALHEKLGFKKISQFEQIGFKFGKWIDVGYWELKL